MVGLESVVSSPTNPRKTFERVALEEMTASVKKHGILQPVLLRPWPGDRKLPKDQRGTYELVSGERRLRAAKAAGLGIIPALVRLLTDAEVLEIQIVENLQRTDLHPLEEAEGYRRLMAAKYDVARIAGRVGRSVAYVYDQVKLLNLTREAQELFRRDAFTKGHAVILARLSPADQKRAMAPAGGLFTDERGLVFTPEEEKELKPWSRKAEEALRKPRSVRELQSWVDKHTKLEADQVDPMLFPETAQVLQDATAHEEKVVRVTYSEITPDEVRDGKKVILGRSWKRADGQHGSKQCDRSVVGTIVIGPGRGQALRVCIDKKRCTVHWGDLIKAAKKREKEVTKAGATGEDREALRRKKEAQERARREADEARWEKAEPAILDALAAAIRKAAAGPRGAVGKFALQAIEDDVLYGRGREIAKYLTPGETAEDLVRYVAFGVLMRDVQEDYGQDQTGKTLKALGVDAQKIIDQVAPAAPSCRECGCTEDKACPGGCGWVETPDKKTKLGLCSACAPKGKPAKKAKKKA
jgi:ParB/RepB/Spo0J family partition protein